MRFLTRRGFLHESALLASAAAILGNEPAVLAADEKKARDSVQDKLRVAVVGVHGRGMSHVGGFAGQNNCVVTTICDADKGVISPAMKAVKEKQGKEPAFEQDIRKVVEDKNIDVIAIATPNHWHALATIWALQNNKHVYVEKPVSHNVWEGRRMVDAARYYKRICQSGTQSRSTSGMREAIKFIHDGKIGEVKLAKGLCYKRRPSIGKVSGDQAPPKTMDYDLWTGPAELIKPHRKSVHYDWHWIWNTGNGDLGNQGIHEMDKARWGLKKSMLPRTIMSVGGRLGYVDDGETPNTQVIFFDYGDCQLIFEVRGWPSKSPYPASYTAEPPKKSDKKDKKPSVPNYVGNVWYGSKGVMVCPNYSGGVAYDEDGKQIGKFGGGGEGAHFKNFVDAIRSNKPEALNADIEEGHLSSAMCHLGNISYRVGEDVEFGRKDQPFGVKGADESFADMVAHLKANKIELEGTKFRLGKKLTLDATKETFVGSKEADKLLTREYRKGFEVPTKF
jgi:hypothetical protein